MDSGLEERQLAPALKLYSPSRNTGSDQAPASATSQALAWEPQLPNPMSDLFKEHNEVSQDDCVAYAQDLVGTPVRPVPWQGGHSYTLVSERGLIVQFRSESSPLDISMTALAKAVHRHIAPATTYQGLMPNSSVSIWMMEALPGLGYLFGGSSVTMDKLETTVIDFARFYASSWKNPQPPGGRVVSQRYKAELTQLSGALSSRLTTVIQRTYQIIDTIIYQVPWVLTHQDLSDMNILADSDSGHITGVVDWADACIEPFGIALWGLESILGYSGPEGFLYYENDLSHLRRLFRKVLLVEIGGAISDKTLRAIEELRTLGLLLRYGFDWDEEARARKPSKDTTHLDIYLQSEYMLATIPLEIIH
ncbi:MAG: hypothetical protein Q9163_001718 [Psora crenata]